MTGDKLSRLLEWFKENEIKWEQDLLEIRQVEGSFGVYALKDISKQKRRKSCGGNGDRDSDLAI